MSILHGQRCVVLHLVSVMAQMVLSLKPLRLVTLCLELDQVAVPPLTAEVDGITSTNPQRADTDGDGLNDSYEALTLLTDPTSADTDRDGIDDGVEVNGAYGVPPQPSNPRNNNTDGDAFDDGEEDTNFNGVLDAGETDPTRMEDSGDEDNDGIQNWEENLSCTTWDIADTDFGGINDGDERNVSHGTDPCDSIINFDTTIVTWNSGTSQLQVADGTGFNPSGGVGWYNTSGTWIPFAYANTVNNAIQGVSTAPNAGVTQVSNRNGSFCHTSATAAGTIGTTQQYCDDDYSDSDGDGLADWQELLGTFGWFSNPTLADTDADGVSDFDEVFDNTDPNQPCTNLLDDDLDGLNNYFETTTGCDLSWIGILNGSTDVWVTDDARVIPMPEALETVMNILMVLTRKTIRPMTYCLLILMAMVFLMLLKTKQELIGPTLILTVVE